MQSIDTPFLAQLEAKSSGSWLISSFFRQILPRLTFVFFFATLIGYVFFVLDLSSFPLLKTIVICFFWLAALVTASFIGNSPVISLWVLLLNSVVQIYQVAIYPDIESPIMRVGPLLLSAMILLFKSFLYISPRIYLYGAWVLLNVPALIGAALDSSASLLDAGTVFVFTVFYPLVFAHAADAFLQSKSGQDKLRDVIVVPVLAAAVIPLILAPLELLYRDTTSLAVLQYGRSYWVLGCIVLVWPVLSKALANWGSMARTVSLAAILLTFVISFSRGAAFFFVVLALGTIIFNVRFRSKFFWGTALALLIIGLFGVVFMWQWVTDAAWYWLLRFNVASNDAIGISFNLSDSLSSGRSEIWGMALSLFKDNPFWGYGIGSTSHLVAAMSDSQFMYGSFHGLFLTVLVERGVFGLLSVILLMGRIVYLMWTNPSANDSRLFLCFSFLCFLFFANTTGIELFLSSSRSFNVDVTLYLFLLVVYFDSNRRSLLGNARQLLKTKSHN